MGFLVDVAVGTAVIVLPKHNFVLLGLAGGLQAIKSCADRKKRIQAEADLALHTSLPPATLNFSNINCSLETKANGGDAGPSTKHILEHVSGSAVPGRLLAVRSATLGIH